MSDDVLEKINKAFGYAQEAHTAINAIVEADRLDLMDDALAAMDGTATDLAYEAWSLRMSIWAAMGRIPGYPNSVPSFLGTRKIPKVA